MKIFSDLRVFVGNHSIEEFMQRISESCTSPWRHAIERELKSYYSDKRFMCFEREKGEFSTGVGLVLLEQEDDTFYVPNIIPISEGVSQIDVDEYNLILRDFADHVIAQAKIGTLINYEVTKDSQTIDEVIPEICLAKLNQFSILANKFTNGSHPLDRARWFDFLICTNNSENELNTDLLVDFLVKNGWSEESANTLAIQFEFAQGLLNYNKGKQSC